MTLYNRLSHFVNEHPLQAIAWWLILMLLIAFALAFPFSAHAADADLTWVNPTQMTTGAAIPTTGTDRLLLTRIEYGTCTGTAPNYTFGTKAGEASFNFPATSGTTTGHAAGSTVCFRAYARLASLVESAPTGVVYKVFAPLAPQPPTGLTVTEHIVYHIQKRKDKFVMLPVGTVPAGTVCDTTQNVNGYYVVPRDIVAWTSTIQPQVVVSPCS